MATSSEENNSDTSNNNMLEVDDSSAAVTTTHSIDFRSSSTDTGSAIISIQNNHHEETSGSRPTRESVLQRLSEALLRHSLAKIDLSQRGLRPSDARLVKMALSQNSNLTVLKLGYNNLGDVGITTLAAGIAVHKSLVSLDLGFNNCGDEGCKALASGMQEAATRYNGGTIQTLYLAGNLIGEDGAIALADFLRRGSSLRKLYLTGNRIGTEGVKSVTEAILEDELRRESASASSSTNIETMKESLSPESQTNKDGERSNKFAGMQELFLGGTGLGNMGCQCVARLIQKASHLKVISLPNCNIGDEEVGMLAAGVKLSRKTLPLSSIQLSFNNITHRGLEILINAIWGSSTLRELKLDNNEIGDRGAHQIAAIIPVLKTLEVLDVGFNAIKVGGLNVLMKAVAQSARLNQLSISGNAIDVAGSKAVAYALAYNRSLQSIFLVHCSVGHEAQRHITAGIVSNSRTALRDLTGFHLGPVVATLGFPAALEYWTNEQVLNFIHLMWDQTGGGEKNQSEVELDPLNFLSGPSDEENTASTAIMRGEPLEANVVVEVAQKAYESLVENGVDVFSRRRVNGKEPSFGSPLAGDAIMVEVNGTTKVASVDEPSIGSTIIADGEIGSRAATSFVAEPEVSVAHQEPPDPERKRRIVEWLCQNIKHLNELSQKPFNPSELWSLHQHYFTPVVNESGGAVDDRIVSSVPDINRATIGGSSVTPSTQSSDEHLSVPASDTVLQNQVGANSLPALKRKVSYRFLGDASIQTSQSKDHRKDSFPQNGSVARMIEDGHTGHSMPPKTKKARRNRTRISFVPRIKAKLDSYLDVCHEKALSTMRQLYFVEHAILSGQINPVDPTTTSKTHLSGTLAAEAEMIVVDMI